MKGKARFTVAITFLLIFVCLNMIATAIADATEVTQQTADRASLLLAIVIVAIIKYRTKIFDNRDVP